MKKRMLAVILTLAMTASLAVGCGAVERADQTEIRLRSLSWINIPRKNIKDILSRQLQILRNRILAWRLSMKISVTRRSRKSLVYLQQAVTCRISSLPGAENA